MKFINQVEPLIDEHEISAMEAYLRSGAWLTEFEKTAEFERRICEAIGCKYAAVVNNGTISLSLALLALGIGRDDEVLVPNLTMIASPNAAILIGARPVLVDINEEDLCMDFELMQRKVTKKTRAVMFVSLNGRGKYISQFRNYCLANGLHLVEDAAQSFGSSRDGVAFGTHGEAGSFSFSPHKIITTGQGGAVVTNDQAIYTKVKKLKDFGRLSGGSDVHDSFGINAKFTDVQAVIGIEQIKKLDHRLTVKKQMYRLYQESLADLSEVQFIETDLAGTAPWFVDIYVDDPDALQKSLKAEGIGTRRIYPPIHSQKCMQVDGSFPVSDKFCSRGLWLPSSVGLSADDIDRVTGKIKAFYRGV